MKLLAPAGNFECLKAAVYNGADEVYLGINQFNARNNVDGFTIENLGDELCILSYSIKTIKLFIKTRF